MLTLSDVTIQTREEVLSNVSVSFEKGKIYGISAPNGSGKTSLFRTIVGLLPASSGSISYDNQPIEAHRSDIFYLEETDWLDNNLSSRDYLNYVKSTWQSDLNLDQVAASCQMESFLDLPIKKYSSGMKQRLIIGLYLISDATCLIMDEIVNALDEESRENFFAILEDLRARNKLIILSSHYSDELASVSDVLYRMKNKRLEQVNESTN